jgi:hypothetical protein
MRTRPGKGTQSFGSWLFRRAAFALIASCGILGALLWAQAHQPTAGDKPPVVGSPAWLVEACQPVPVGEYPSAVVIRPAGKGNVVMTTDATLLHQALDQELAGVEHGHEVYDFCA